MKTFSAHFNNGVIILITVIISVIIIVMLNFHSVTSLCETDQFTLLQLSLQLYRPVENLWCKLDLKESVNKSKQKQEGEGAAELLPKESHATASLISKCYQLQL